MSKLQKLKAKSTLHLAGNIIGMSSDSVPTARQMHINEKVSNGHAKKIESNIDSMQRRFMLMKSRSEKLVTNKELRQKQRQEYMAQSRQKGELLQEKRRLLAEQRRTHNERILQEQTVRNAEKLLGARQTHQERSEIKAKINSARLETKLKVKARKEGTLSKQTSQTDLKPIPRKVKDENIAKAYGYKMPKID